MNTALVFVQIARHLYQVMTPKVTISAKEEDTDGRGDSKVVWSLFSSEELVITEAK